MINLIRSEWIKFRSVRSTVLLVLSAGLLVIVIGGFAVNDKRGDASSHLGDITVGIPFALFLFGTLGVQIIGQEYRFNTIRPTFTAAPWRVRVLIAKLIVVTAATAVVALVMVLVCALVGMAVLDPFTIDGLDQRVIWGTVVFAVGWTMMGMGVGAIIRQPVAGIVILLVEAFVAENILANLVRSSGKWLPFLNGIQMTVRNPDTSGYFREPLGGGIYFFAVAIVVWVIGALLVVKRDA